MNIQDFYDDPLINPEEDEETELVAYEESWGGVTTGSGTLRGYRSSLSDLYFSPEVMDDIRRWGVDQIDEVTRRELYAGIQCSGTFTTGMTYEPNDTYVMPALGSLGTYERAQPHE